MTDGTGTELPQPAMDLDYRELFHGSPSGYLVTLDDGTIVEANATFANWIGHPREELVGTSLLSLLPVGDRIVYSTHALPQLGVGRSFAELAVDFVSADSTRLPALISATRHPAEGSRPAVDRVVVFNAHERRLYERELVTALRAAERAESARASAEADVLEKQRALREKDRVLQESLAESRRKESLLQTVLDTVEVGVSVVDEEGNTILTNSRQRFIHRRALPPGTTEANECELLIFGPDRTTPLPAEMRPVRRTVLGQSFSDYLVWFGTGEQQRAFSVTARSVQRQGGFQGSVLAFSDVTGLVNAVAAKEDFVANVSHELRTPLTSIMGYLDLALEEEDKMPAYVATSLRVAQRNSEKLLELVSDLLSAAAGPSSIERAPADLAELLRSALTSAAPQAEISKVQLVADFPWSLPAVLDPQRVGQVIDNLLSNAVKYSPDGGRVTVRAWDSADTVEFEVADTGIGMTEAEQSEVFTKFFRSGTSRKAAIPGVGLGLVISKNIVDAHCGTITLSSEAGKGTVFRVRLPKLA
ncbi:PAS domain-containing sensor histidine kinase [Arthrobacter sp. BL-252-APC-1A]|uniref:ATP-binding protein n=1 Tax=Arthrobacter sp. BL-252-APC-1A TaxID=2606622 RepID=UPI0012B3C73A|nr:PAS domain-containing sensor histidine kinase [Arthrobacter sp. BL-252-APC-1A]MSS00195.1 PAS domain-containing sensor histidine kinase [Arthrobacter sp. BL-252-APC-1A]